MTAKNTAKESNMTDIEKAKKLLEEKNASIVLCRGGETAVSCAKGIAPMIGFIGEKKDLRGFSAADRIVGKAAAMLFVFAGITEVYAEVLSVAGEKTLAEYSVKYSCGKKCDFIENRMKTGMCPMEQTVEKIDTPEEAYKALCAKLAELRGEAKK